jgi:hypothetical protein
LGTIFNIYFKTVVLKPFFKAKFIKVVTALLPDVVLQVLLKPPPKPFALLSTSQYVPKFFGDISGTLVYTSHLSPRYSYNKTHTIITGVVKFICLLFRKNRKTLCPDALS